jgi:hypothetical protein
VASLTLRSLSLQEKKIPLPTVQEAGWAPLLGKSPWHSRSRTCQWTPEPVDLMARTKAPWSSPKKPVALLCELSWLKIEYKAATASVNLKNYVKCLMLHKLHKKCASSFVNATNPVRKMRRYTNYLITASIKHVSYTYVDYLFYVLQSL